LSYKLESKGYARHFKVLNENLIALPPLSEQHRIVEILDELIDLCNQLKALIYESSSVQRKISDILVSQALH
jgi:type I restriction enzyme S subunit